MSRFNAHSRILLVVLALSSPLFGCVTDGEPELGVATDEVTWSSNYTLSPQVVIALRVYWAHQVADGLQALAAGPAPKLTTWTDYNAYKDFVTALNKHGTELHTFADALAAKNALTDDKDALADQSEAEMLLLQQAMEKKAQLAAMVSNSMKAMSSTAQTLTEQLK